MKIVQLSPGIIEIPPKGWGAIEEVIWNYKLELEKFGYEVELLDYHGFIKKYEDEGKFFDVVHIHVTDQSTYFIKNNIPYYFTLHDIHTFLYSKNTKNYLLTSVAINHSMLSFSPSMFLISHFSESKNKMIYLQHGFSEVFKPLEKSMDGIKLLSVSKNTSICGNEDNKGYIISDKIAKELNLEITFVGDNQEFFDKSEHDFTSNNICRNVTKMELVEEFYGKNHILLHMSKVESGQPCLVISEAMGCGLPIVATHMDDISIDGIEFVEHTVESGVKGVKKIINNYNKYRNDIIKSSQKYTWKSIVSVLKMHYSNNFYKMRFVYKKHEVDSDGIPYNSILITEEDNLLKVSISEFDTTYNIKFKDIDYNIIHESNILNGNWCGCFINNHKSIFVEIDRKDYCSTFIVKCDLG